MLEIDHFDPREKRRKRQHYDNLFPATPHCNRAKSATWPSRSERIRDLRFLNCCKEGDYDHVIFEDPGTHRLVGLTVSARYHIAKLELNAAHLVRERQDRANYRRQLSSTEVGFRPTASFGALLGVVSGFRRLVEQMIPPILPPPSS